MGSVITFRNVDDAADWKQVFDKTFEAGCRIAHVDVATAFSDALFVADKYLACVRVRSGESVESAHDIDQRSQAYLSLNAIRSPDDEPLDEAHRKWLAGEARE